MFTIHLFTKPSYMLTEGEQVTVDNLMKLKNEINSNLDEAIEAVDKLTKAGFDNELQTYDIGFWREDIESEIELRNEVAKSGLDPNLFDFEILWESEDSDDNEVVVAMCECCGLEYCPNCGQELDDEADEADEADEDDGMFGSDVEFGSR